MVRAGVASVGQLTTRAGTPATVQPAGTGFSTVVACAAGYRAPDDPYAARPKVRYPASEMLVRL